MNHIFYLHSNTCVIASYDIIDKLLSKGENVIVVTERGTGFPFFDGKVSLFDVQKVINAYRIHTKTLLGKVINYKTSLHPHCRLFANEVINSKDFILYTPSYNMYSIKPFLYSNHCKGYYFIEEGFMAYLSKQTLQIHFRNRQIKKGHILMHLVGAGESFDYKITKMYKGCIGLSEYSFPWCKDNKIITSFDGYFSNIPFEEVGTQNLITTDWLSDDVEVLKAAFKITIQKMNSNVKQSKIAIKFHPSAFVNEKHKIDEIVNYIHKEFCGIDFFLLPASFSVEALLYYRRINLYCIFGVSSLQLYAIMLKSTAFMVGKADLSITEIKNIPEFLDLSTKDWHS